MIVAFYGIGLPLGYTIGIRYGLGLNGLWMGMIIGIAVLAASYFYLAFYHFDWNLIAIEA